MRWTGVTERTVKYWLAGENGPAGEHLLSLVRNSDAVFTAFLDLAGRPPQPPTWTLIAARDALDCLLRSADLLERNRDFCARPAVDREEPE
jgi:hypothetical protein